MVGDSSFDRQETESSRFSNLENSALENDLAPVDLAHLKDKGSRVADGHDGKNLVPHTDLDDHQKEAIHLLMDQFKKVADNVESGFQQMLDKQRRVLDSKTMHQFLGDYSEQTLAKARESIAQSSQGLTFCTQLPIQVYPSKNLGVPETIYVNIPPKAQDIRISGDKLVFGGHSNGKEQEQTEDPLERGASTYEICFLLKHKGIV